MKSEKHFAYMVRCNDGTIYSGCKRWEILSFKVTLGRTLEKLSVPV